MWKKLCFVALFIAFANGEIRASIIPIEKPCNGGQGECVPFYLCLENGLINKKGVGLINPRHIINVGERDATECLDLFETCCGVEGITNQSIITTTRPPPIAIKKVCGKRNPEGVGFGIAGNIDGESEYGEFPWMVAITKEEQIDGKSYYVYKCGGSLIHPQVVLTAAHCVQPYEANKLVVRVGEWDTQTINEPYQSSDIKVTEMIIHEGYTEGAELQNNLALLFLEKPADDQPNIDTICLPPQNQKINKGTRCFASGWGKDVFGKEGKYSVILKKIELPIVPHGECQDLFRSKTRLGRRYELDESFICAGGEPGKDTCKGDGGSPLVCAIAGAPGHYYQAGIVSWGIGCGEDGVPGAYTNLPMFRDWIDQQMASKGFDQNSYNHHLLKTSINLEEED